MSLTETCVGLAIAATAMVIATPSLLRAREEYVLTAAAHDVATKMYFAKINAVTRNRDCRLSVTSAAAYIVECHGAAWETIDSVTLRPGISISTNAKPTFHRRGAVVPTATVTVSDSTGHSIHVIVNVNGRVRLQ